MGKAGNKARKTRRGIVAEIEAKKLPWETLEDTTVLDNPQPVKEKEVKQAESDKYRVTILKDHKLEFPNLGLQLYISCSEYDEPNFVEMFTRSNCMKAVSPEESDLVIFGGGADVDPCYYGEVSMHPKTRPDEELDMKEMELYYTCYGMGIPMLGICRGAQFLWAMNDGKLFQDVDNHNRQHPITEKGTGLVIERASSVHHQMCYPNLPNAEIIATANVSRNRWLPSNIKDILGGHIEDIEAYFIPETACLGFQGHPEYKGFNFYTNWCLQKIEDYICDNPDITYRRDNHDPAAGMLRIKPELLAQREALSKGRK